MRKFCQYQSPIGIMKIVEEDGRICGISLDQEEWDDKQSDTPILREAVMQLEQYFAGKRKIFELPLTLQGTKFQVAVWNALMEIPYGETRSYGEIAKRVGNAKASRAVGMANHRNPIMIVVPCHRVIGASGKLIGYASGVDKKQYLLELEKN